MSEIEKVVGSADAWDSGELGRSMEHAQRAPEELDKQVDDALGMQAISIRLEKDLIKSFKLIAQYHGIGYQPLMRDALKRFAESEFKVMATKYMNERKALAITPPEIAPDPNNEKKAA